MDLRRHLADALSAANAACGVASTCFALAGRADVSLLLLLAGAVCDGLDGAAARRFGGTRFGVLADDVARPRANQCSRSSSTSPRSVWRAI